jgi:hypothetical protein
MIVGDLLRLEDLHLGLAWGTPDLLDRQVTGVTSTDLLDPARYLQPGELVLSGLVWWRPESDAALRFATSLRSAGVAALLAGEGTHGEVPPSLVDACRTHGIPLLVVPSGTSFRAVTDRIYLRLWGDLNGGSPQVAGLPEGIRQELAGLLEAGTPLDRVLARAVTRLGLPRCSVRSAGGRLIAGTGPEAVPDADGPGEDVDGSANGVRIGEPGDSPFDGWYLTSGSSPVAHGPMLHGLADLLAPLAARERARDTERRGAAAALFDLLAGGAGTAGTADEADLADALGACGLPPGVPLTTVTARIDRAPAAWAADALTEALRGSGALFAVGADERGDATALTAGASGDLPALLPGLQARLGTSQVLRMGVGPAARPVLPALRASLVGARYALAAADPFADADQVDSLARLLAGIPREVTAAFQQRLLAPLVAHDEENSVSLLGTLGAFLDHDCSWSRTAKALHIHVNTVHYRVRRIEELTGRDLARLADQIDLRAALLCAPRP